MHAGDKVYDKYELKVYCDMCGKQDDGENFRAELKTAEKIVDLGSKDFAPTGVKNQQLQICHDCYKKIILPNLYGGEKDKKD